MPTRTPETIPHLPARELVHVPLRVRLRELVVRALELLSAAIVIGGGAWLYLILIGEAMRLDDTRIGLLTLVAMVVGSFGWGLGNLGRILAEPYRPGLAIPGEGTPSLLRFWWERTRLHSMDGLALVAHVSAPRACEGQRLELRLGISDPARPAPRAPKGVSTSVRVPLANGWGSVLPMGVFLPRWAVAEVLPVDGARVRLHLQLSAEGRNFHWALEELDLGDWLHSGIPLRETVTRKLLQDAAGTTCQVCGEPMKIEGTVVCSGCSSPHHRDCWEWVQGCSTYGCRTRAA